MEKYILYGLGAIAIVTGGVVGFNSLVNSRVNEKIEKYEDKVEDAGRELESRTDEVSDRILPQVIRETTEIRVVSEANKRNLDDIVVSGTISEGFVHSYNSVLLGKPIDLKLARNDSPSAFEPVDVLKNVAENSATRLEDNARHNALIDWIEERDKIQRDINNK